MSDALFGFFKALKDLLDLSKDVHVNKKVITQYLAAAITLATFCTSCRDVYERITQPTEAQIVSTFRCAYKTAHGNNFAEWLVNLRVYEITDTILKDGKTTRVQNSELDATTLEMMDHISSTMIATSSDAEWWKKHSDYTTKNMHLAGVKKITRIFLYRSAKQLHDLEPLLREQKNAGIDVWTAPVENSDEPADYVFIDDGRIAGRWVFGRKDQPTYAEFCFDQGDIDQIRHRIALIQVRAEQFGRDKS